MTRVVSVTGKPVEFISGPPEEEEIFTVWRRVHADFLMYFKNGEYQRWKDGAKSAAYREDKYIYMLNSFQNYFQYAWMMNPEIFGRKEVDKKSPTMRPQGYMEKTEKTGEKSTERTVKKPAEKPASSKRRRRIPRKEAEPRAEAGDELPLKSRLQGPSAWDQYILEKPIDEQSQDELVMKNQDILARRLKYSEELIESGMSTEDAEIAQHAESVRAIKELELSDAVLAQNLGHKGSRKRKSLDAEDDLVLDFGLGEQPRVEEVHVSVQEPDPDSEAQPDSESEPQLDPELELPSPLKPSKEKGEDEGDEGESYYIILRTRTVILLD